MHRIAHIAALTGLLFTCNAIAAAPPASGTSAEPAATTAPPATPPRSSADQQRVGAIQQYQHDLVSVVALRADAGYLLGAAILAKPFEKQTPGLDFDALSARAAAAPGAGPATRWARLAVCETQADCPNAEAFAYLKEHAADNAAVWLVELDLAAAKDDAKAEHVALQKAAAATSYDDYYGQALAGVARAVDVLPPLPDTTDGAHDGQPDNADGVRVLVAANATRSHPRPDLDPLVALCASDAVADDKDTRQACLKVAHTLQWGSSPIARAAGLHIQGRLEPDDKSQTGRASRDLAWQVQQYSTLLQRALTDSAQASRWLATARNGGTELSLILATLRANGVPLEAPADDTPAPATSGSS